MHALRWRSGRSHGRLVFAGDAGWTRTAAGDGARRSGHGFRRCIYAGVGHVRSVLHVVPAPGALSEPMAFVPSSMSLFALVFASYHSRHGARPSLRHYCGADFGPIPSKASILPFAQGGAVIVSYVPLHPMPQWQLDFTPKCYSFTSSTFDVMCSEIKVMCDEII